MKVSQFARKSTAVVLLVLLVLGAAGCETLQFYRQVVWGQWQIMAARQDTATLLADTETAPELADRLAMTQQILAFARDEVGLHAQDRYLSYVQLDRDYVLWNVFAARPFSLDDDQWCYPIIGCAPYRGYFDEQRARQVAQRYAQRGFETYVGGVPAYSTLGWFDDPLLSTFVDWPAPDLANLLIHELAHSRIWVNGDVGFNESFAEFVGMQGTKAWFTRRGELQVWRAWQAERASWRRFRDFTVQAKSHLQEVYLGPEAARAAGKQAVLSAFQACYQAHRDRLGGGRYDALMAEHFNNAFLLSVGTYADWLPSFARLFEQADSDWAAFFEAVEALAAQSQAARDSALAQLAEQQIGQRADDHGAEQIHCEAFLGHGLDAEPAG